jgi:hypothetical protein
MTMIPCSKTTAMSSDSPERSVPPVIFQRPLSGWNVGEERACERAPNVTASGVALLHAVESVTAENEPPACPRQVAFGRGWLGRSGWEAPDRYHRLAKTASPGGRDGMLASAARHATLQLTFTLFAPINSLPARSSSSAAYCSAPAALNKAWTLDKKRSRVLCPAPVVALVSAE